MMHGGYLVEEDDDARSAFPRLENRTCETAEGQVLLKIHQRREDANLSFEVWSSAEGKQIPMNVCATTEVSSIRETLARRSPWLSTCLDGREGFVVSHALGADDFEELFGAVDDEQQVTGSAVQCRKLATRSLELTMPSRGAGQNLLTPASLLQCLELSMPVGSMSVKSVVASAGLAGTQLFTILLWAFVLGLPEVVEACRDISLQQLEPCTVALVLGVGHAIGDAEMLRQAYWCVREALCTAGVPEGWLDGSGPVRLIKGGYLAHRSICKTPLKVLSKALLEDASLKQRKWLSSTDCYTLCQVHRKRSEDGGYPHFYELRLDHSDEILMSAQREDEQSPCRIFARKSDSERSEHSEDYLGCVIPNFWGTLFTLYDAGADVEALSKDRECLDGLPLRPREVIMKIGYETNVFGDSPRKVSVEFVHKKERPQMGNLKPRWDKKLNSYALPFFGRVKKASAKNFQLVVNGDQNTIFLMFGKISKDVFCLDFRGPIAPLEAFAIASAALAKKRAVS